MSDEQDEASKTEEPTHKRLEDARKKGQIAQSREINHFFVLFAFACVILVLSPAITRDVSALLMPFVARPDQFQMNQGTLGDVLGEIIGQVFIIMLLPLIVVLTAILAIPTVQKKWIFSTESIKPKLEKLSPLKGFKRIYGGKALIEFGKSLLKISAVGIIVWLCSRPFFGYADSLLAQSATDSLLFAKTVSARILITVCILLFLLSVGDFFLQRFMFLKSMRMTKQELKDEYKQQEGDPHIKAKLRQIRREKAQRRMMANVPKADVVITNPTHYAVALQYDPGAMTAPKVVAKGVDAVAARIREVAEQHKIPVMRNPPLARILYDTTDIDDDIPVEHYQAVAKIIGFVYRMKGKGAKDLKPAPAKKPKTQTIFRRPKGS